MPSMANKAIKRRHFAPRNVLSLVDRFSRFGDSGSQAYGENLLGSVCVLLNRNPELGQQAGGKRNYSRYNILILNLSQFEHMERISCLLLNRNHGTWPTNFHRTLVPEFDKQGSRETF